MHNDYTFSEPSTTLTVPLLDDVDEDDLTFSWEVDTSFDDLYADWQVIPGETGRSITVTEEGNYLCTVTSKDDEEEWDWCFFWADLGWEITNDEQTFMIGPNEKAVLSAETSYTGGETASYRWYKETFDGKTYDYAPIPGAVQKTYAADSTGNYYCQVTINGKSLWGTYYVSFDFQEVIINGLYYELNSMNEADQAGVWGYDLEATPQGDIVIQPAVTLANGKTYQVTEIYGLYDLQNITSITIPECVTKIDDKAIGYYGDGYKLSDLIIIGKTGSEAQRYANANGFLFRDPEAEAAAAAAAKAEAERLDALEWNGTASGSVPAAKSVKARGAKKKLSVSWTKPAKKKLKKFDKVEIQVCPDRGFARANTRRIEVKKSRKSCTVKGLAKKTTYYVRVRNVKGSGTAKVVSRWSKVKKVKTAK